jgi:hypothetical protein
MIPCLKDAKSGNTAIKNWTKHIKKCEAIRLRPSNTAHDPAQLEGLLYARRRSRTKKSNSGNEEM